MPNRHRPKSRVKPIGSIIVRPGERFNDLLPDVPGLLMTDAWLHNRQLRMLVVPDGFVTTKDGQVNVRLFGGTEFPNIFGHRYPAYAIGNGDKFRLTDLYCTHCRANTGILVSGGHCHCTVCLNEWDITPRRAAEVMYAPYQHQLE